MMRITGTDNMTRFYCLYNSPVLMYDFHLYICRYLSYLVNDYSVDTRKLLSSQSLHKEFLIPSVLRNSGLSIFPYGQVKRLINR